MGEIFFAEQKNGYDKTQVDNYIHRLTEAYQTAYNEYQSICAKYNDLTQDYKKLETERQSNPGEAADTDVIAKVLVDAEVLARKIREDANAEAAKIVGKARKRVDRANEAIEQAMSKIKDLLAADIERDREQKVVDIKSDADHSKVVDLSSLTL